MLGKCPQCGGALEAGYVESARKIYWTHQRHKIFGKPAFYLPGGSDWNLSSCPAQRCTSCNLIFISIKEDEDK